LNKRLVLAGLYEKEKFQGGEAGEKAKGAQAYLTKDAWDASAPIAA